jgi:maleylacetoacetate isomerase
MKFYGYFRSSSAYRCRIAFNLKGVTPDHEYVHLRKGEHKAAPYAGLNPQKLVPALEVDGTVLTQSLAIIEWLDEAYPNPALLPAAPLKRARARAFAMIMACEIHPLQNLRILSHLKSEYGLDQDGANAWARHWNTEGLDAAEAMLAREDKADFCFGDTPGLADICLVPQIFSAERFGADTSRWPNLMRVNANCNALPAFIDAQPKNQPDFEA